MEVENRENSDREFPTTVGACLAASVHCVDDEGYLYVVADENAVIRYGSDGESFNNTVECLCQGLPYREARTRGAKPVVVKSMSIGVGPGYGFGQTGDEG